MNYKLYVRNILVLVYIFISAFCNFAETQCTFDKSHSSPDYQKKPFYKNLQKFYNKRFSAKLGGYTFDIGICTKATSAVESKTAGAVMSKGSEVTVIGALSDVQVLGGNSWVLLRYMNGESGHTSLMILCNPQISDENSKLRVLDGGEKAVEHLFELEHKDICSSSYAGLITFQLSVGTIIVTIFLCLVVIYLVAGIVYKRVLHHAKGWSQIPNYEFWKDFGNLQADGCNFVCRSSAGRAARPYKGIGDEQLDDNDERDDHLLPM